MAGKNLFVKVMFFRSITDLQTILIYENDVDVLKELVLPDDLAPTVPSCLCARFFFHTKAQRHG
jgi:hypothetical protein